MRLKEADEEAKIKSQPERERLLELSRIAKDEQAKAKAIAEGTEYKSQATIDTENKIKEREKREQEILAKDPKKRTKEEREIVEIVEERNRLKELRRKTFEKRLTEFVGLTEKERKVLERDFELTGFPPDVELSGRTPEERNKKAFWLLQK